MKPIELSKRLLCIANLVESGTVLADVGTDHGYIPIYLAERGLISKAFALDIHQGPLNRAMKNIVAHGVESLVIPRLSDGLEAVLEEELGSIIMAGMGGMLICELLERGKKALYNSPKLILSPHLDETQVRKKIHQIGYKIIHEELVEENNQYYTVIGAIAGEELYENEWEYLYGKVLIMSKNKVLEDRIKKRLKAIMILKKQLSEQDTKASVLRMNELEVEQHQIDEVMKCLLV